MRIEKKTVHVLVVDVPIEGPGDGDGGTVPRQFIINDWQLAQLKRELLGLNDDWRVAALMGLKIDAIKMVRTITGAGLKEAKDAVEAFCGHCSPADSARDWIATGRAKNGG